MYSFDYPGLTEPIIDLNIERIMQTFLERINLSDFSESFNFLGLCIPFFISSF